MCCLVFHGFLVGHWLFSVQFLFTAQAVWFSTFLWQFNEDKLLNTASQTLHVWSFGLSTLFFWRRWKTPICLAFSVFDLKEYVGQEVHLPSFFKSLLGWPKEMFGSGHQMFHYMLEQTTSYHGLSWKKIPPLIPMARNTFRLCISKKRSI